MDISKNMLAPAAVLILWTLVMVGWTAVARFGAFAKIGVNLKGAAPGGRGQDLEGVLPPKANWKSHNYTHLMEQPTIFYATALVLALAGLGHGLNAYLAWGYVGLRVVHSLVQATTNIILLRWALFMVGSLVLLVLAIRAAMGVF